MPFTHRMRVLVPRKVCKRRPISVATAAQRPSQLTVPHVVPRPSARHQRSGSLSHSCDRVPRRWDHRPRLVLDRVAPDRFGGWGDGRSVAELSAVLVETVPVCTRPKCSYCLGVPGKRSVSAQASPRHPALPQRLRRVSSARAPGCTDSRRTKNKKGGGAHATAGGEVKSPVSFVTRDVKGVPVGQFWLRSMDMSAFVQRFEVCPSLVMASPPW